MRLNIVDSWYSEVLLENFLLCESDHLVYADLKVINTCIELPQGWVFVQAGQMGEESTHKEKQNKIIPWTKFFRKTLFHSI